MDLSDYPPEIQGPSAWYGPELDAQRDWIEVLSGPEVAEIERAVRGLIDRQKGPEREVVSLRRQHFPLPTLAPRLERILNEVLTGRGFVLLRRLPVERWSKLERAVAFCGLGAHWGNLRSQNAEGHLLGHVKDLGDPEAPRLYKTNKRQGYHTDSCDIVGLLCLNTAKEGGLSSLVSSMTLFNEIRRRRSDLLACLFAPIETDRRGEVPEGQKPYFRIPIFNWHGGLLSAVYQRKYIDAARQLPGVAPYTKQQEEALDLFDHLADDPALHLRMELQRDRPRDPRPGVAGRAARQGGPDRRGAQAAGPAGRRPEDDGGLPPGLRRRAPRLARSAVSERSGRRLRADPVVSGLIRQPVARGPARELLTLLARGAAAAPLTWDAKGALERLAASPAHKR
jgi:hypothetical protein